MAGSTSETGKIPKAGRIPKMAYVDSRAGTISGIPPHTAMERVIGRNGVSVRAHKGHISKGQLSELAPDPRPKTHGHKTGK